MMNKTDLLKEIQKTQKSIQESKELIYSAYVDLSQQQILPPYCYLMPVFAFALCYKFHDKIALSSASTYFLRLSSES